MELADCRTMVEGLMSQHGIDAEGWTFEWDRAMKRGGAAHFNTKTITMSMHLVPRWEESQVRNIALHEIAHVLAGHDAGHGPAWRRVARMIGCTATRMHANETVPPKWAAFCDKHGEVGRYHRRRALACRRCYNATGVMVSLKYKAVDTIAAVV